MKALEKRPDMRYPTMDEMMRAMSDPVGYVESHGGIAGFMHRQLTPSSAPLPPIRMTPSPMTTPMNAPTPVPGHLTPYGMHSPIPGNAVTHTGHTITGQRKSRLPLLIAAGIVVVGAAASIAYVVTKKSRGGGTTEPIADTGSGTGIASAAVTPPPLTPDAAEKTIEVDARVEAPPPVKTHAKITIETNPSDAEIYINGILVEADGKPVKTPASFEVPISAKPVKLTLRREGFEDIEEKTFAISEDVKKTFPDFKKKKSSGTGKGSAKPPGKGSGTGKGSSTSPNDTGLLKPE
jgi:hypothetical protein